MIVLARSLSAACLSSACACLRSRPLSSMSNTLPWRTLATPSTPRDFSAPSIALPWGSRMPDFRVTVTRAFMVLSFPALSLDCRYGTNRLARNRYWARFPSKTYRPQVYAQSASVHRGHRLLQQPPAAGDVTTLADEPHGRPERRLRARNHRNAVAVFQRLRHAEGAQAAAGDQQAFGPGRLAAGAGGERDDVGFALLARLAEPEQAETVERQHLEVVRLEKALQAIVHLVRIGGGDHDPPRIEAPQPIDHRLAHGAHRQAGGGAQFFEQLVVEVGAAIERQRGTDHHDGVDALLGEIFGGRENSLPGAVVALGRERPHAHAARDEPHARIHLQPFLRHLVLRERHDQSDGEVLAHVLALPRCLETKCRDARQSSVAPAALMIGAHFVISARM